MKIRPGAWKPVIAINNQTGEKLYFKSASYAKGFERAGIKEVLGGRAKSHRGYAWRYATQAERELFLN